MGTITMTRLCSAAAALSIALAGCGGAGTNESMPNPGENVGTATSALSVSTTLYYEGACWWLQCVNGHNGGACGYGCSDTANRLARDYSWRLSCGRSVQVVHSGRSAYATVWDQSCCAEMEGNNSLLNAVGIGHGDGTCGGGRFTYGYGQGSATFYY